MMLATARQRSCMQVVGKDTRRDLHRVPVFFMSEDTTMTIRELRAALATDGSQQ